MHKSSRLVAAFVCALVLSGAAANPASALPIASLGSTVLDDGGPSSNGTTTMASRTGEQAALALETTGSISGSVTVSGLVGAFSGSVLAEPVAPDSEDDRRWATIGVDGQYSIVDLRPGEYTVCIEALAPRNWKSTCWEDDGGSGITVEAGAVLSGYDITTEQYGGIQGTVLSGQTGTPAVDGSIVARLYRDTPNGFVFVTEVGTQWPHSGQYRFPSIEPGTYAIEFAHLEGWLSREYWDDARYFVDRTDVTVAPGPSVQLGDAVLQPRTYDRERLQGPDRFATSVEISKELFPGEAPDVPVVYIANGLNYPDALAAGPAAAHERGGLLLVAPNAIPPVVATELARLDPQRIVIVGGTPSVSGAVQAQLSAYAPEVVRIGGADRFATSRLIVQYAWQGESSAHAFLATGLNYPDALSAAPAAGVRDAPIVLVNGGLTSMDAATRSLLTGLNVEFIHVVGSSASVSDGIQSSAIDLVGADSYVRYAGFNRFATAVLVSIGTFSVADYAFVATGLGFADALAGGPLAAALGAPMYLSNGSCLEPFVMADIDAVGTNKVYVLGSSATQSSGVYNLQTCSSGVSGPATEPFIRVPEDSAR